MIYVITARPRVGKTLHAVHLLEDYRENPAVGDDGEKYEHYFIGNIDGYAFDEVIPNTKEKRFEVQEYLAKHDWETKAKKMESEGKKMILAIDEAQLIIGTSGIQRTIQEELFYFFEYHGHYGMDILLITQNTKSIHTRIYVLIHEIHKVSKIKLNGYQSVTVRDPDTWDIIETIKYKDFAKLYPLYISSHSKTGHQKPKSGLGRIMKLVYLAVGMLIISIGLMIYFVSDWMGGDELKHLDNQKEQPHNKKVKGRGVGPKQIVKKQLHLPWWYEKSSRIYKKNQNYLFVQSSSDNKRDENKQSSELGSNNYISIEVPTMLAMGFKIIPVSYCVDMIIIDDRRDYTSCEPYDEEKEIADLVARLNPENTQEQQNIEAGDYQDNGNQSNVFNE